MPSISSFVVGIGQTFPGWLLISLLASVRGSSFSFILPAHSTRGHTAAYTETACHQVACITCANSSYSAPLWHVGDDGGRNGVIQKLKEEKILARFFIRTALIRDCIPISTPSSTVAATSKLKLPSQQPSVHTAGDAPKIKGENVSVFWEELSQNRTINRKKEEFAQTSSDNSTQTLVCRQWKRL